MEQYINMSAINLEEVENEWKKLINGESVNKNVLRSMIYESWMRSLKNNINPYVLCQNLFISEKEIELFYNSKEMEKEYGDILTEISEIVKQMNVTFTVFDKNANLKRILVYPDNSYGEKKVLNVAAEDKIGTNAVCLALKEKKPIQIVGAEHFNHYLHNANCSAAPIHNEAGEIIGAINISSFITKHTVETLGLVASISKILDSYLLVNKMLRKLTICNFTLSKIIEYLPNGIIYLNSKNEIINYNQKLLNLLNINKNEDNETINKEMERYFGKINLSQDEKELDQKEIILKVKNRKKSFLISTKKILDYDNQNKGRLMIFEDTNKVLKLQNILRGNKAEYTFESIIGNNHKIQQVKSMAKKIAGSSAAVLIYGESGTGKEVFAQAIHNASLRKDNAFVAINCGAIPSELIESELFGYEPGAFTGALKGGKPGKLEIASEGTLFLDEVESMPLNVQIKMLRAISTSKITRIGGIDEISINIRLISATKKDLLEESENGTFREDLYYRLNIVTLKLPPLRERKSDIPTLVKYFVEMFSKQFDLEEIKVDEKVMEVLPLYYWRGNVRELKNVIERSILLRSNEKVLTIENIPKKILKAYNYKSLLAEMDTKINSSMNNDRKLLKIGEEIIIELVLKKEKGNLTKTAERLGISRPTLYKKIKESKKLKSKKSLHYMKT